MGKQEIEQRVEEILDKVEEYQDENVEEALMEVLGEGYHHLKEIKEKRKRKIQELKNRLEAAREKIERKERQLERKRRQIEDLKEVDTLEELTAVSKLDMEEEEFASTKERKQVADKVRFLADKIEEGEYLTKDTLKTFDLYRSQLIDRTLEEQDMGERLENINR